MENVKNKSGKKLLISHTDLDGFGCIFVFKYFNKLKDFDEIILLNYNEWEPYYEAIKEFDEVYITDFSPDVKALEILIENKIPTVIIDHHKSAYEDLKDIKLPEFIKYIYDDTKSGTKLTYEYVANKYPRRVPSIFKEIVELINTYDLFLDEDIENFKKGQDFNRYFWKKIVYYKDGYERYANFIRLLLEKIKRFNKFEYTRMELAELKGVRATEATLTKQALKKLLIRNDNEGNKFGLVKLKKKVSIIAYNILKKRTDVEYLLIINEYNPELKMSVRSRKDGISILTFENVKGHPTAGGLKEYDNAYIEKFWKTRDMCLTRREDVL